MAFMKEALGIAFAAGLLSAGLTALVPIRPSEEARPVDAVATRATGGSGPEMTQVLGERLYAPLSAAYGTLPIGMTPQVDALTRALPMPPAPAPAPIVVADAAVRPVETPPGSAAPRGEAPVDGRWTPKPQPDLIAKAEARFDNGDVAGARSWLDMANELGDAEAAFRLAETYDPAGLAEMKAIGIASDVGKARTLYERAVEGGIEAARKPLERLSR